MPASCRFELFPLDLKKSVDFYTRVLDFKLVKETPPAYAYVVRDSIRIGLAMFPPSHYLPEVQDPAPRYQLRHPPLGTEIVIEVDDLDGEHDKIVSRGWKIAEEIELKEWGLRDFRILDVDGYYLRFTEPANARGGGRDA